MARKAALELELREHQVRINNDFVFDNPRHFSTRILVFVQARMDEAVQAERYDDAAQAQRALSEASRALAHHEHREYLKPRCTVQHLERGSSLELVSAGPDVQQLLLLICGTVESGDHSVCGES